MGVDPETDDIMGRGPRTTGFIALVSCSCSTC